MITDNRCLDHCRKPSVHLGPQAYRAGDLERVAPGDLCVWLLAAQVFQNHLELELGCLSASILLGHDIFSFPRSGENIIPLLLNSLANRVVRI